MKTPRRYAWDYLAATNKDDQRTALAGCPQEWQELVKTHIRLARERMKAIYYGQAKQPLSFEERERNARIRARQDTRDHAIADLQNMLDR